MRLAFVSYGKGTILQRALSVWFGKDSLSSNRNPSAGLDQEICTSPLAKGSTVSSGAIEVGDRAIPAQKPLLSPKRASSRVSVAAGWPMEP